MKKKLFVLLSIFVLVMPFMVYAEDPEPSADPTPTASPEPSQDPVEIKITMSPSSLELNEGDSKKLSVELEGTSSTVTWKSSDTNVATVDNGTVTAKKAGTATITAEVEGKSANCAVTVKAKKVSATLKNVKIEGADVTKVNDTTYNVNVTDESKFSIVDDGKHVIITLSEGNDYRMTSLDSKNEFKILVGDNTYTFKVTRPAANTNLSKLEVSGYAFDQTFNKDTTNYTVTVPYDITTVTINATTEDDNAKISTGKSFTKDNLQVGGNTVTIKVTNGSDSKTYKIFITREEEKKEKEKEKITSGNTSKITSKDSDMDIPETTSPDSILDYIIITLGTLVLFSIGGIGIFFYFKTSPKRMKKELLKKKKTDVKEESPIVEIEETKEEPKKEIKDYDNDIEEL